MAWERDKVLLQAIMANLLKRKLDGFCSPGSLFWITNSSCSHRTGLGQYSSPGVTVCFEDTAVLFTISILFWASAGLRLLWNGANTVVKPKHSHSFLSTVKVVVISVPVITAVCDFIFTVYEGTHQQAANFQYLQPIAVLTTSILAAAVTVHERWLGIRSSTLMFLLWLGLVIYGGLKMWTLVTLAQDFDGVSDKFRFITFCLQCTAYLMEFILTLLPDNRLFTLQKGERKQSPEEGATFLSRITWWWLNRLIWLGWRKSLVYSNLADLNEQDKSKTVVPSFMKYWDHELNRSRYHSRSRSKLKSQPLRAEGAGDNTIDEAGLCRKKRRGPSLLMAVAKTIQKPMAMAAVLKLAQDLLGFVSPQILRLLINFASDAEVAAWKGYLYAVLLFAVAFTQAMLLQQHFIRVFTAGMRTRTAVIAAVYNKALRLSCRARRDRTVGEIVNLMSVDAERLKDVMTYFHSIWSAPLQIVLAIVFLWFTMGPSIFVGVMVLLVLIPVNTGLAAWKRRYQVQQLAKKDERLKLISEVLNGIKVIKLYAWEIPFQKQIVDVREAELRVLRKSAIISVASTLTWYTAPFLVTLATVGTYVQVHKNDPNNRLTAERAFVALSLFNLLQFPLIMLPYIISKIIEANVSMKRVRSFLKSNELDPGNVQRYSEAATGDEDSVSVVSGTFTWDEIERPTLSSLHLHIKPGQLVAVVGQVGAGKSSLISSLLGDMERLEGSITLRGSVAYVPQQAWILNTTLKDNILFAKPEDTTYYETVLHSCALDPDLKVLPGGDMTEIGEKGINLSGGQKQRVSLARAVYQDSDVYLMDDPLSAVDSHVSRHIFEKVVGPEGLLKGKVRILVTHGLMHLPQCDVIVVMDGGRIVDQGSYSELIENDGVFADFLHTYANVDSEDQPEHASDDTYVEALSASKHISKPDYESKGPGDDYGNSVGVESILIAEEKAQKGVVNFSVILSYCKACAYWMAGAVLLMSCILNGFAVASNFWLAKWSNAVENTPPNSTVDVDYYLSIFSVLGFGQAFFAIFAFLFLVLATIKGSRTIHSKMLSNILRSPMSFFDTTPLGRIMNRFSKDIYNIDEVIPPSIDDFLGSFFMVVSVILVVTISTPIFMAVILPLGVFYWFVQRFYIATARQLERLVSITRSPIYSHFQESIAGASSIRAYKEQQRFIQESARRVDDNNVAYYPRICANRWLAVRLEFIGNLVVFFAALFAAIQRNYSDELNLHIDAGIVGLSITYALQVTMSLNWMVRMASELEANIVAVERTKEYSESPTEAPASIDGSAPPAEWPSQGCIRFDHYSTRYREGLDLVLKDITTEIRAGSKIGIVGRTGAGKSSFTLALFRIVEAASGSIVIDDVDIASIGLQDLRSRITIIPQDPVIFAGTLRVNLDPFELYTDDEIWCALGSAHLQTFVSTLDGGLKHAIAEGGENLSVGQRQLVCLARALLRKTKILVLDEATAAVDLETDNLIQETIRSAFASCTVLTIAHRINTIMDYDYVMVLQEGSIVEYDTPRILLDKKGQFYSMAKQARVV